jgi:hypothetical protein
MHNLLHFSGTSTFLGSNTVFCSAACSQTLSIYILALVRETKFHIRIKQTEELAKHSRQHKNNAPNSVHNKNNTIN